ncbi:MAG TPA: S41 family peptidase [Burkholderiaceae bacterium]|jgi:hypothetical protein
MKPLNLIRSLLVASATVMALGAQAAPAYDAAAWQADYSQLKKIMEKDYANLAWFASPEGGVDLPALDRKTLQALRAAGNDEEARRVIAAFVASFKGGHFSVSPALAKAAVAPKPVAPKPFDAADTTGVCAGLGFLPNNHVAFSLPLETLPNFQLLSDGLSSVYRAGVATASDGRKIGVIRIQNFRLKSFPATCTIALKELRDKGAKIDAQTLDDTADDKWTMALSDEIKVLKAAGISALLIDIGDNSGGDDHGDQYARLLTGRPVRSARLLVTANAGGKAYADEQVASLDEVISKSPPPPKEALDALTQARDFFVKVGEASKTPCDLSWVWKEQRPWANQGCKRLVDAGYAGGYAATLPQGAFGDQNIAYHLSLASSFDEFWGLWTGPLYVLTDGRTYSSAEMFAAVVQDNRIGKTVGATTGGDGCGFMSADIRQTLPHSGLSLRIPNCVRLRADGSNEVTGIAPDIPVLATEGEDGRQRGERLIEAVSSDNRPR